MISVHELTIKINKKPLIENLNIAFDQGEFWAVIGKNGTGKTTLLNTIAGFNDYEQGSILINGKKLEAFDGLSKAQSIAFLPQLLEASLDCSIEQSIKYGRYPWHQKHSEKQDVIAVEDAIQEMELNEVRGKSIQQISGGELRKVEIATVLAQDSEIMILDEPLNHLDLAMRYKLMLKLKKLSKNKTIIIVTHDIQYVQEYCTHVLMLTDSANILAGKVKDIMTSANLNMVLGIPKSKENIYEK